MIREGDDAIPLVTTRRAFGNQETSKQRSAIVKIVHSKHFFCCQFFIHSMMHWMLLVLYHVCFNPCLNKKFAIYFSKNLIESTSFFNHHLGQIRSFFELFWLSFCDFLFDCPFGKMGKCLFFKIIFYMHYRDRVCNCIIRLYSIYNILENYLSFGLASLAYPITSRCMRLAIIQIVVYAE